MYWERFGFVEPPFALTPNPGFLFLSACHQEALAHLLYGVDHQAAFIELSGEVGSGKTTLIRSLLAQLDPAQHRTAFIFNPPSSPLALLQEVSREFGLPSASAEPRELLQELNAFLLRENAAGRGVILVVDEAQNLSAAVLEQVRLISNLETERAKLIQIVLVGQPELRELLDRRELRQLRQRITVRYHLERMSREDTAEYIRHRVRVASRGGEPITFSPSALRRIFRFSGGLPRLVNAACDRAVLAAYTGDTPRITGSMASRAVRDLRRQERGGRARWVAAGCLCSALLAAAFAFRPAPQKPPPLPPPALTAEAALPAMASVPEGDSLLAAANAVLAAWKVPKAEAAADISSLAASRGLAATELSADLPTLQRLDAPVILHFPLPGGGIRYAALTAIGGGGVTLRPAPAGRGVLTREELAGIWRGKATVLWKNFYAIAPGKQDRKSVRGVQQLLQGAGMLQRVSGRFDRETAEALRLFQQREGLAPDGRSGELTLLHLYRRAGGFFPPGIVKTAGEPR
ncbi:MAG TPA: AAA family ATPase [Verrucomicrobiae bacterium]|nr:AAA family ATPase [Verrucomicrobiae bacterium]